MQHSDRIYRTILPFSRREAVRRAAARDRSALSIKFYILFHL